MSFQFIPASDERARFIVDILVGDKTLEFNVPLMPFVAKDTFAAFRKWAEEHPDSELVEQGKRPVEEVFDFMVKELDIDHADEFISKLVYGEKSQLWDEWTRRSDMPLGESSDSATS